MSGCQPRSVYRPIGTTTRPSWSNPLHHAPRVFHKAVPSLTLISPKLSDQFWKQFEVLNKINPNKEHHVVALGSIVFTEKANYFISTSVGELLHEDKRFYAISMASPIARLLVGKTIDQSYFFQSEGIAITKII